MNPIFDSITHLLLLGLSACSTGALDPIHPLGSTTSAGAPQDPEGPRKPALEIPKDSTPEPLHLYPGAPFETRSGEMWFTSVGAGVVRYDGKTFTNYTTENGLAGNILRGVQEDEEGRLWFPTDGGISIFDGESFESLLDYGDHPIRRTFLETGDHRDIWDLLRDSEGTVWIATLDGVFRLEGTTWVPFPLPVQAGRGAFEFTPRMVYDIYEDRAGDLWFSTDGAGVVRYDGEAMEVFTAEEHGLSSNRVSTTFQDSRGTYWFGTSGGGVSRYEDGEFTTHFRSATFSPHSGWGRCFAIHEDREGSVWFGVASEGGGVHRFDGEAFRYFSVEDGLGTGGVPSIREDRSGRLWFGTTSGVYHFDGERFFPLSK